MVLGSAAPPAEPVPPPPPRPRSERTLLLLVGAVQLVNVLDFMMVMPLGPDFAAALGIPPSRLGLVGGAYTVAASLAGIAGATFLDRFDRRTALGAAMLGLVAATCAGGFARGLGTMLAARLAAGAFGGPATSLSLSIVADAVPAARRGAALGAVMSAFSVAAVLGVPAGLELARVGGWRAPFFAVAALGLVVAGSALALMRPMRAHLAPGARSPLRAAALLHRPVVLLSLSCSALAMVSAFAVTANTAAWVQLNLGWPRARLGLLYMAGGATTFATMRLGGRLVDRFGSPRVAAGATALFLAVLALGYAFPPPWVPVVAIFVALMVSLSTRNVAISTLSSKVPSPDERARFMSAQSAVQHLAAGSGAGLSTALLTDAGGRLAGMTRLAGVSAALSVALPIVLWRVAERVRRRDGAA